VIPTTNALPRWRLNVETKTKRMTVDIHSTTAFHGFLIPRANAGLVQITTFHFMLLTQPSRKLTSNYLPKYSLPHNIKIFFSIQSFKESGEIFLEVTLAACSDNLIKTIHISCSAGKLVDFSHHFKASSANVN